jgi:hypothetical protein
MNGDAVEAVTALAAENRSLEIDGAKLRYRRFGDSTSGALPLVCLQHFRGNLDNWDPASLIRSLPAAKSSCSITAALAGRPVSLPTMSRT